MSDAADNQQVESETTVKRAKRRGRGRKRTPTKIVTKVKRPKHDVTSEGSLESQEPPAQQSTQHTVSQPPHTVPQTSPVAPQSSYAVPKHPHAAPQPVHAVHLLPNVVPQPPQTVPQAPHAEPHPTQTTPVHAHVEGASLPTFVQFAMPPNFFPSPVLNSTLQTPLQHSVPSSLSATNSSTLSLLSALQDDKLGLILPVLVRMEHKIDQIMAMIGAKSSVGMSNGPQIGNQLNTTVVGNQSNAAAVVNQSNTSIVGNQSIVTGVGSQSNVTAVGSPLNATVVGSQLNATVVGNQSIATENQRSATAQKVSTSQSTQTNVNVTGTPSNTTANAQPQSNHAAAQSSGSTMDSQSNNSTVGSRGGAAYGYECKLNTLTPLATFNSSSPLPGMSPRQRIRLEMAKITEKTLPDDLNLPISRDEIISLHARSNSTMNFAVRLLRELFTRDELLGRNLSGARGKDRVDPARVAIIKQIVFKIYQTSPSDKELLWKYCHKAMDSYLRKMQRPIVVKNAINFSDEVLGAENDT